MALFSIVHEIDGERRIFIQEAGALITARIKASIAGFDDGEIGRALSPREVSALLKQLS